MCYVAFVFISVWSLALRKQARTAPDTRSSNRNTDKACFCPNVDFGYLRNIITSTFVEKAGALQFTSQQLPVAAAEVALAVVVAEVVLW